MGYVRTTGYSLDEMRNRVWNERCQKFRTGEITPVEGMIGKDISVFNILSDIGAIFLSTDYQSRDHVIAEKILCDVLSYGEYFFWDKVTAYVFLDNPEAQKNTETTEVMNIFRENPANGNLLAQLSMKNLNRL